VGLRARFEFAAVAMEPFTVQNLDTRNAINIRSESFAVTVHFSCPKCGLSYKVIQEKVPEKRTGRFDCMDCRAELHVWSGIYDFTGWKPVWSATERNPSTMGWKL
jgi:predicted RNA-binding Zn-ribbon protein involved in translation (DUF1610 family)